MVQPNQPIVIMTAHIPVEQVEELLIRGAVDFISKPFRPEQLRSVAEVTLRRDDYMVSNRQFAVPKYLTGRLLNVVLNVEF